MHPSIWVGSLLDYNNGILHGEWLDAARDETDVQADIIRVLAASPTARAHGEVAEEWGIFDLEGFGPAQIGEYESIALVAQLARGIAEHGEAFAAYFSVVENMDELASFEDDYQGHWHSVDEYAEHIVDELGYEAALDQAVPESLRPYVSIDTEQLGRDLLYDGSLVFVRDESGGVWLFSSR